MIHPLQMDIVAASIDSEVYLIIPENKILLVTPIGVRMELLHDLGIATPNDHPVTKILVQWWQNRIFDRPLEIVVIWLCPEV